MSSMFVYKGFVQSQITALSAGDWQRLTRAEDFSDDFVKYTYPKSMNVPKQTREDWYIDLTSGFVAKNYQSSTATLTKYWENIQERSAIAWLHERGKLINGTDYEFDYLMRYEFDEHGKVAELFEYNDSRLQSQIANQWVKSKKLEKLSSSKKRFFLLSYPRTASNLFMRMMDIYRQTGFAVHPSRTSPLFYMRTLRHRAHQKTWDRHSADWTDVERSTTAQSFQVGAQEMEDWITKAELQGDIIFIKEHVPCIAHPAALSDIIHGTTKQDTHDWTVSLEAVPSPASSNGTILPDEFLKTFHPTFLVRHPALVVPSQYRTYVDIDGIDGSENQKADFKAMVSIKPVRRLYDWYCAQSTRSEGWPIVLEANDLIHQPTIVTHYATRLQMTNPIQTQWSAATPEEKAGLGSDAKRRMKSTLIASTGVLKEKAPINLDLEVEKEKWYAEFGREAGTMIEKLVMEAIPDYEYLNSRKLKVPSPPWTN